MDKLKRIWRSRKVTKATKLRLVRSLVFPIFLYVLLLSMMLLPGLAPEEGTPQRLTVET